MPHKIQKSLKECISKIKIPNKQIHFQFRNCKHPKTPSFAAPSNENNGNDAVSLSDIDRFLFENFRSLYLHNENEEDQTVKRGQPASFLFDSPRLTDPPPPENLCSSARFFVASGSSTSLITDEVGSSSASAATNDFCAPEETEEIPGAAKDSAQEPDDFIAILTYSPSPYEDFRRSMQEMVEARLEHNGKVDWEFMEELLFCYLDLNNKKSYRFILHAFVDLVVVLRENSGTIPGSRQPRSAGGGKKQLKGMHA